MMKFLKLIKNEEGATHAEEPYHQPHCSPLFCSCR